MDVWFYALGCLLFWLGSDALRVFLQIWLDKPHETAVRLLLLLVIGVGGGAAILGGCVAWWLALAARGE